jgi:hypothetical protein
MPEPKSVLDLSDLTVSSIEVPSGENLSLEEIAVGGHHLMTETGASAVGANVFICSCCCCC